MYEKKNPSSKPSQLPLLVTSRSLWILFITVHATSAVLWANKNNTTSFTAAFSPSSCEPFSLCSLSFKSQCYSVISDSHSCALPPPHLHLYSGCSMCLIKVSNCSLHQQYCCVFLPTNVSKSFISQTPHFNKLYSVLSSDPLASWNN